ncbi:MAG TPA: D-aminoacyl-tRNA deacylase [Candidatus Atribacteria bacterium]|nr:D-aminoacyl-tRNA deacylase [Candidatus Atribacteria bacterium]HPU08210.1 D-aminoacyl-tRNA deacylase [Candidatus Atribacteria bacterium]HPZ81623.1 D-aminoacyl-tRNA deacylase [Candidatus Atribacteria bacterium]HQE25139.1 D-aminoacyl-tRNA deacylase [Candidatus Atribacteria bacterium]
MRAVIQRVKEARVRVEGKTVGEIGTGLLVLLGVHRDDGEKDARFLINKVPYLRIFEDEEGKMNRSVKEVGGEILLISQFTLYGDCRRGLRPSFDQAAPPEVAKKWYEEVGEGWEREGVKVERGVFGAFMEVEIHNQGPVTIILDSKERRNE